MLEEHTPTVIDQFNGLWKRGENDSCPQDHFTDCNNIAYLEHGFRTRDGIDILVDPSTGVYLGNILRMYKYTVAQEQTLLVLIDGGKIYQVRPSIPIMYLILTIPGMTDFGFQEFNQRAYITPTTNNSLTGMVGQNIYVYVGTGLPARPIGGTPPVNADGIIAAAAGAAGSVEKGIHMFGVVYETDTGYLTQIGPDTITQFSAPGSTKVNLTSIPVSPNSYVVARRIVATKAIDPALFNGDTRGYEFFYVPGGRIPDNTTTALTVDFYDQDLLDDATHLLDLYSTLPAGGGLTKYHNRLVTWNADGYTCTLGLSYPNEPEAFDKVSGIISIPLSDFGISACWEYRDLLYVARTNETWAFTDNNDVPTSWPGVLIDAGIGVGKHGVLRIGEAGGSVNLEYIAALGLNGIFIFNGMYQQPELSFKVKDLWTTFNTNTINFLSEFYNDPYNKIIYINIPDIKTILMGDYSNGINSNSIKWALWTFEVKPNTMTLMGAKNDLIIGGHV